MALPASDKVRFIALSVLSIAESRPSRNIKAAPTSGLSAWIGVETRRRLTISRTPGAWADKPM